MIYAPPSIDGHFIKRLAMRIEATLLTGVTIVTANSSRSEKMPQPGRTNAHVVLAKRPTGWVDESCFRIEDREEPSCGAEDVIVQAVWLSLDPYLRGRMNEEASYAPSFEVGKPLASRVVGRVLQSRNARFSEGDYVWGFLNWAERTVLPRGEGLHLIDPALGRPTLAISALGMPGLTAWVGAMELGRPQPGDTVYISSAAGAVGQLAGQFARRAGARVVGSAGSDEKVSFVQTICRFHAAFNYRTRDMDEALRELCPNGIDVYFDNVGGSTLEAALRHANAGARFPICGMISEYNAVNESGIKGMQAMFAKRIAMTGFMVSDHVHKLAAYQARVAPWLQAGEIYFHEDIVQGLEQAPSALIGMMRGTAIGKRLVQIVPQ
ncbi:NADP-dependent oxidoreductase [Bradyrhizobium sp. NAS96.2]|uniref:NADP-dependent oxidoreductase n=1 Tax=Bradyrhizobium sp. NAS96.2 TaxID=1680160 RepID=UPI0009F8A645|nr:NADP-dependent oxidoreductase [Bradyrhizobium sp. NAS96.2]